MKHCRRHCRPDPQPLTEFRAFTKKGKPYHANVCRTCVNQDVRTLRHLRGGTTRLGRPPKASPVSRPASPVLDANIPCSECPTICPTARALYRHKREAHPVSIPAGLETVSLLPSTLSELWN